MFNASPAAKAKSATGSRDEIRVSLPSTFEIPSVADPSLLTTIVVQ